MQSMREKAQNARKNYTGNIFCLLTCDDSPRALPNILQHCLQSTLSCLWIEECIGTEQQLYKELTLINNEQKVIIMQLPFTLAPELYWIAPDIVIFADWEHAPQCFTASVLNEMVKPYQQIFKALEKVQQKKAVQLVISHDVYQYDAIQRIAVNAGFRLLHSFGKNPLATLRLVAQQLTPTGQNIIVRYEKSIRMYRFPVTDFYSTYSLLACLSVLRILQREHSVDLNKMPLQAYYSMRKKQTGLHQKTIGFICDRESGKSLEKTLITNYLGRAIVLTQLLQQQGLRLFLYSPADVDMEQNLAHGYFYDKKQLVSDVISVPKVNANWIFSSTYAFSKEVTSQKFLKFLKKQCCDVYTGFSLTKLTGNKYKTYQFVRLFDQNLQPQTELHTNKREQLERLLLLTDFVFLKPIAGNNADDIISVKKQSEQYLMKHHFKKKVTVKNYDSIRSLLEGLKAIIQNKKYIIQEGVISARCRQSIFEVRILMSYDGTHWHWLSKKRCAKPESDVSNFVLTEAEDRSDDVLQDCFGKKTADRLMQAMCHTSQQLLKFLQCFFQEDITEISFDYIIDANKRFYFIETHAKAGLSFANKDDDPFDFSPTSETHVAKYIKPHLSVLAKFFLTRWQNYDRRYPQLMLEDLKQGIKLTHSEEKHLLDTVWLYIQGEANKLFLERNTAPRFVILTLEYNQGKICCAQGIGLGLREALERAANRLYVRYQNNIQAKILQIEIIEAVVYIQRVNLSKTLPNYHPSYGIALDSDARLCFSSRQIRQCNVIDEKKQFDFEAAKKMLAFHPWLSREITQLQHRPSQRIIYFKTHSLMRHLAE